MALNEKLDYLSTTKNEIKQAIISKGQEVSENNTFREYAQKISNISTGTDTSDATATADDILSPKTAYAREQKITGTIETESIITSDLFDKLRISALSSLTDYRLDLGYALAFSGRNIYIYQIHKDNGSVSNNDLVKTISLDASYFYVGYNGAGTNISTIRDCKFMINSSESTMAYIVIAGHGTFDGGSSYGHNIGYATVIVKIDLETLEVLNTFSHNWVKHFNENVYGGAYGDIGIKLIPLTGNKYVAASVGAKYHNGDIGVRTRFIKIDTSNDSTTAIEYNGSPTYYSNTTGFASENGRYVMTTNGSNMVIALFNDGFTSVEIKFSNSTFSTIKPVLLTNHLYYNLNLYNASGSLVHTYSSTPFNSEDSYKFYTFNYVIEMYENNAYIYKFDETNYSFTFIRMIPSGAFYSVNANSATGNISYFPVSCMYGATFYNSDIDAFNTYYAKENVRKITAIHRGGYYYTILDGTNATADKLLMGYKAYSGDSLLTGTMPNNGALNITPNMTQQSIPAGYTSGGTVSSIENTTNYSNWFDKASDIIGNEIDYELEYIESNGNTTQVNTDIIVNEVTDSVIIDVSNPSLQTWEYLIQYNKTRLAAYSTSVAVLWHQNIRADISMNLVSSNKYTLNFSNGSISLNGVTKLTWTPATTETTQSGMILFPKLDTASYFRIYEVKVVRSGEVIHDLIPVLHKVNNEYKPCFYDKNTGSYYYNSLSGTLKYKFNSDSYLDYKLDYIKDNLDENLLPENIKSGVSILSVTGTADIGTNILDVSDDSDISVSGTTLVIDTQGGAE